MTRTILSRYVAGCAKVGFHTILRTVVIGTTAMLITLFLGSLFRP